MSNEYTFVTRWRVEGTCGEVADILGEPLLLTQWWPAVYLRVDELEPPDSQGLGRSVRLVTQGWLPYTLTWESRLVESRYPGGFTIEASGDVAGVGKWMFVQDGREVDITYVWSVRAEKPLLKTLSPWFRPLLEANHRWAMRQGEASLALELRRRRAINEAARAAIPPPPAPVTYAAVGLVGGATLIGGTLAYLMLRARRRSSRRGR